MNQRKPVKVYAADRRTLLGEVHPNTTSIGAAKVANAPAAQLSRMDDGYYAWIAKGETR